MQKLETAELIAEFARCCGTSASLVGVSFMVGSIFFGNPTQRTMALKLGGLSLGSGLFLTGAAFMGQREIKQEVELENKYAKCVGCKYWHGSEYGDNYLVCAVHPEGVEGDYCKDWNE